MALLVGSATKLVEQEEVVRLSQNDLNRLERLAQRRQKRMSKNKDYFEVNVGDQAATAYMHHPTASGVVQDAYHSGALDLSQWHNYGFEWSPGGLTGYIDGQVWFHDTDPGVQAPGPMHQTIQLDNFCGCAMQQAYFDVDWARVYAMP